MARSRFLFIVVLAWACSPEIEVIPSGDDSSSCAGDCDPGDAVPCPADNCGDPAPDGCADGEDNDGDGWTDSLDPDCLLGDMEVGTGTSTCNDGIDNDGDEKVDANDPECANASADEILGVGACTDRCRLGAVEGGRTCELWDGSTFSADLDQSVLHHRARVYTSFLRDQLMPEGGIFRTYFATTAYETAVNYGGARDAPIWTGTYLAAEVLRYQTTAAPDALRQVEAAIPVLHRWWRISGDRGYLARFAAPESAPQVTLDLLPLSNDEVFTTSFEGAPWRWRGNISRDQYQGVFLGFSLAYEVVGDALKAIIRDDVVETIEQLMARETRTITFLIDGVPLETDIELESVIYTHVEPEVVITVETNPFTVSETGLLAFWPNPAEHLRQISLLSWLPDVPISGQSIQLGGMFRVALQVTEGIPEYAERRAAIQAYYDAHFDEWATNGAAFVDSGICGAGYHGKNIAFTPAFNWVRLEDDPSRRLRLQTEVLRDAMWAAVAEHKNVWFAYIYAANAHAADDTSGVVSAHTDQLRQFPQAPNVAFARDLTGSYPIDQECTEKPMSTVAVDVGERIPVIFMWERNPWNLVAEEDLLFVYPGHDYLIAYWMARRYGFLDDDASGTCLVWR